MCVIEPERIAVPLRRLRGTEFDGLDPAEQQRPGDEKRSGGVAEAAQLGGRT